MIYLEPAKLRSKLTHEDLVRVNKAVRAELDKIVSGAQPLFTITKLLMMIPMRVPCPLAFPHTPIYCFAQLFQLLPSRPVVGTEYSPSLGALLVE